MAAYIRKTKDIYLIMYKYRFNPTEQIDSIEESEAGLDKSLRQAANRLLHEHRLAYMGQPCSVWMVKKRIPV